MNIENTIETLIEKLKQEAQSSFSDEVMRESYVSGALNFWKNKILNNPANLESINKEILRRIAL